jgi:hypothetical protein
MFPFDVFSPRVQIVRQVRKRYGAQADAVMRELDRYVGSAAATRDRVHRAILTLADDSFENLKRWVQVAVSDYRDVLGPAEYPGASTADEVRQFNTWKLDPATVAETSFAGLEGDPEPSDKPAR